MDESYNSVSSSLIQPIDAKQVLIKGEKSFYDERMHWAALFFPFAETLGALTILTVGSAESTSGQFGSPANLMVLGAGALYLFYRWSNPPKSPATSKWAYLGFALLAVIGIVTNQPLLVIALIIATTGRFVLRFVEWMWYERLFITNRRLILAKGLLGSDFSTMPLTRLTDINYNTTIPGEFLGYAMVRVETAGQDQALSHLNFLTKPLDFYQKLINLSTAAVGSVTDVDPDKEFGTNDDDKFEDGA